MYNLQQFTQFVQTLTKNDRTNGKDTYVCFQTLHDQDKQANPGRYKFYRTSVLEQVFKDLSLENKRGYCVSFTLQEMGKDENGELRRRKKNCTRVRTFCIDFDYYLDKDQLKFLREFIRPTCVVLSSKDPKAERFKSHFYIAIAEDDAEWGDWLKKNYRDYQIALATIMEEALQKKYKKLKKEKITDKQLFDLARAMRCPGFVHQKDKDNPFPVQLVYTSDRYITPKNFKDYMSSLGITEDYIAKLTKPTSPIAKIDPDKEFYEGAVDGEQNSKLFTLATRMFAQGRHYEEVRYCLVGLNIEQNEKPLEESEVMGIVDNCYNRWLEKEEERLSYLAKRGNVIAAADMFKNAMKMDRRRQQGFKYDFSDKTIYRFPTSDVSIVDRFLQKHGKNYLVANETTYNYNEDNGTWDTDEKFKVLADYEDVVTDMFNEPVIEKMFVNKDGKTSQKLYMGYFDKLKSFNQRERFVKGIRKQHDLIIDYKEFDDKPMLLNCKDCVIDLTTLRALPHSREHKITQCVNAHFTADEDTIKRYAALEKKDWLNTNLWTKFIYEIMLEDLELCRYVQKALGYLLEGGNAQECLFFLYGTGANGKSKTVDTMKKLLGSYARSMKQDALMNTNGSDLVLLSELHSCVTKRVVFCSETDKQKPWNEKLVKNLTGDQDVVAKAYHKDSKETQVKFTPVIMGNHRPIILGADEAIWRRIKLIPYNYKVPEQKRDSRLLDKLTTPDMLNDIFNWLIAGYYMYRKDGLGAPMAAQEAMQDYKKEMNPLEAMLNEAFEPTELYKDGLTAENILAFYNNHWRLVHGYDKIGSVRTLITRFKEMDLERSSAPGTKYQNKNKRLYKLKIKDSWAEEFEKSLTSNIRFMA